MKNIILFQATKKLPKHFFFFLIIRYREILVSRTTISHFKITTIYLGIKIYIGYVVEVRKIFSFLF